MKEVTLYERDPKAMRFIRHGERHRPSGLVALVDDEDFHRVQGRWRPSDRSRPNVYAIHASSGVRMHRFLLGLAKDDPRVVDHIDGNGLNNQRANLRIVDAFRNAQNRSTSSSNTGVLGVSQNKLGRYYVEMMVDSRVRKFGCYKELSRAIEARKAAELKYRGELAAFWHRAD